MAELREGETRDDTHASRNLAQLAMADDEERATIYLAGPVAAYSDGGAAWRDHVKAKFGDEFDFRDPLSKYNVPAEDLEVVEGRSSAHDDTTVGVSEIVERDKRMIDESDGVLVGYTAVRSVGTPMEVMFAREREMPVAIWLRDDTDEEALSPWYRYHSTAITDHAVLALQHVDAQADQGVFGDDV